MKPKAIVFDLDGTLLNTIDDLAFSVNTVLARHGFPAHEAEAYKYFVGNGAKLMVARAIPEAQRSEETVAQCVSEVREVYNKHMLDNTCPYDGVPELLEDLNKRDIALAVLSNKPDWATRLLVEHYFGRDTFACVRGAVDGVALKPDPQASRMIAETLNVKPVDFLHVGDSATDMQTAQASGMTAVGALWGFRTKDELVSNGAQFCVEIPEELLKLLD
jgi:phosphoglycolate phosphatase